MTKSLLAILGSALLLVTAAGCAGDAHEEVQVGLINTGVIHEKFYVAPSTLWQDPGKIPVCWQTSGFTKEKALVKDSVKKAWELPETSVRFTGWGTCKANEPGIHIVIKNEAEFGPHVKDIGNTIDGMDEGMVLDLALEGEFFQNCHDSQAKKDQCNKSVAVHEFGHALGFYHEQERKDTPSSCPDKDTSMPTLPGDKTIGKWDLMSIMNYCYPDRNEVYPDKLSSLDRQGLIQMYPSIEAADESDEEDEGGPSTQSTSGDDDEDAEDEDDKKSTSKKKKSTGRTIVTSGGCSAAPGASSNLGWLAGLGLVFAARKRRSRKA